MQTVGGRKHMGVMVQSERRSAEHGGGKCPIIFLCGSVAGATFGGEFAAAVCALIIAEILLFLHGLSIVMEKEEETKTK